MKEQLDPEYLEAFELCFDLCKQLLFASASGCCEMDWLLESPGPAWYNHIVYVILCSRVCCFLTKVVHFLQADDVSS